MLSEDKIKEIYGEGISAEMGAYYDEQVRLGHMDSTEPPADIETLKQEANRREQAIRAHGGDPYWALREYGKREGILLTPPRTLVISIMR